MVFEVVLVSLLDELLGSLFVLLGPHIRDQHVVGHQLLVVLREGVQYVPIWYDDATGSCERLVDLL